jgi:transketolase
VINTIRTLSIDAVQQAKSGHLGTPMALAPLVYTIWNRALHFDAHDPIWPNRDRFEWKHVNKSMTQIGHHNGRDFGRAGAPA